VRIGPETPLVLGSASPRRRELLASLDLALVVSSVDVDEARRPGEAPEPYLERIVAAKLDGVLGGDGFASRAHLVAGVLVADTIVVAPDQTILGGATHEVRTRFALAPAIAGSGRAFAQTVTTRVTFRRLLPDEIDRYVSSGEGRDKAGAYAVQGRAAAFVERIHGSYTNVVGLPLCDVVVAMRDLGWVP
jgi:septum formation protein